MHTNLLGVGLGYMKEKQIAEAYVRKQRPALMETVKAGVTVMYINSINLNDWLAVLRKSIEYTHHYHMYLDGGIAKIILGSNGGDELLFTFDMKTGQPATEADYQAFNEIVSV